jgi:hypothetical protein
MAQPAREVIADAVQDIVEAELVEDQAPPKSKASGTVAKRGPKTHGKEGGSLTHLTSRTFRMPTRAPQIDKELNDVIEKMNEEFIDCRDYGHKWRSLNASWSRRDNCYTVELMCNSCGTRRTRYIGAHGELLSNSYGYAEGYQMPSGRGRMTGEDRNALRFASLRRIMARTSANMITED